MPSGIYNRDPMDKDWRISKISFGQETAKLEKEFAELQERKKIRSEIDREYLKSEIYQSRDKISELKKQNQMLRQENNILKNAMRIDEDALPVRVCGE